MWNRFIAPGDEAVECLPFAFSSRTPLILAAANGHTESVTLLISQGCNVLAHDLSHRSALHGAVSYIHFAGFHFFWPELHNQDNNTGGVFSNFLIKFDGGLPNPISLWAFGAFHIMQAVFSPYKVTTSTRPLDSNGSSGVVSPAHNRSHSYPALTSDLSLYIIQLIQ
jgi:ankyrin repeat protein